MALPAAVRMRALSLTRSSQGQAPARVTRQMAVTAQAAIPQSTVAQREGANTSVGLRMRTVANREVRFTWERPLAPCCRPRTQSPAMNTLPTLVRCSGRDGYEPGVKCVTAFGNRSTALSTTCTVEVSFVALRFSIPRSAVCSAAWARDSAVAGRFAGVKRQFRSGLYRASP